jgi:hypothetical protein
MSTLVASAHVMRLVSTLFIAGVLTASISTSATVPIIRIVGVASQSSAFFVVVQTSTVSRADTVLVVFFVFVAVRAAAITAPVVPVIRTITVVPALTAVVATIVVPFLVIGFTITLDVTPFTTAEALNVPLYRLAGKWVEPVLSLTLAQRSYYTGCNLINLIL